jgi:hypothetical protein
MWTVFSNMYLITPALTLQQVATLPKASSPKTSNLKAVSINKWQRQIELSTESREKTILYITTPVVFGR